MASFGNSARHDNLVIQDEAYQLAQCIRRKRSSSAALMFIDLMHRLGAADRHGQAQLEAELDLLTAKVKRALTDVGSCDCCEDYENEIDDRIKRH